jgi:16S rRNA G966 N2-methylase RsmD
MEKQMVQKNNKTDYEESLSASTYFEGLAQLYSKPLPASRSGALYSAFSYPTKISPESIAVFIASHTKPGDVVLDTFGGSGTTGLATHLCANPTKEVIELADKLGAPVVWGPRKAIIYELSVLGAFIARTMCTPPNTTEFLKAAEDLILACETEIGEVYRAVDDQGYEGSIRHAIWSDVLECSKCRHQVSFWDSVVTLSPLSISSKFKCPVCGNMAEASEVERVFESFYDELTGQQAIRKKRVLKRIYGQTNGRKWSRAAIAADEMLVKEIESIPPDSPIPIVEIPWGDLHRAGYHKGITHAHHFYTPRNLRVMAKVWKKIEMAPKKFHDALKLLVLSYNATHATLMTRVVVKSGQKDFVLTGAQSGVLYISSLPVEKNIFEGLRRKAKAIAKAFATIEKSESQVQVVKGSSTKLNVPNKSIDYVFTDPPFGDYIPYSEINFLNEVWLGKTTNRADEIIVSNAQKKTVSVYGKMMTEVFNEISRVLKDEGKATVVFHSAKADVWRALQEAYQNAGFHVELSSILDKLQGSFKQVTSTVSVKGDPLLLLSKNPSSFAHSMVMLEADQVIGELIEQALMSLDPKERTAERLYARFIARYLESGHRVPMDAADFYRRTKYLMEGV